MPEFHPYGSLLRAAEVAEMLGVTPPTVYKLVETGRLQAITFGTTNGRKMFRFKREWVSDFISQNTSGADDGDK